MVRSIKHRRYRYEAEKMRMCVAYIARLCRRATWSKSVKLNIFKQLWRDLDCDLDYRRSNASEDLGNDLDSMPPLADSDGLLAHSVTKVLSGAWPKLPQRRMAEVPHCVCSKVFELLMCCNAKAQITQWSSDFQWSLRFLTPKAKLPKQIKSSSAICRTAKASNCGGIVFSLQPRNCQVPLRHPLPG